MVKWWNSTKHNFSKPHGPNLPAQPPWSGIMWNGRPQISTVRNLSSLSWVGFGSWGIFQFSMTPKTSGPRISGAHKSSNMTRKLHYDRNSSCVVEKFPWTPQAPKHSNVHHTSTCSSHSLWTTFCLMLLWTLELRSPCPLSNLSRKWPQEICPPCRCSRKTLNQSCPPVRERRFGRWVFLNWVQEWGMAPGILKGLINHCRPGWCLWIGLPLNPLVHHFPREILAIYGL